MTTMAGQKKQNSKRFSPRFEDAKRKLADFLQKKSDKLSLHAKRKILVVAGLIIASLCVRSVINAWSTHAYPDQLGVGSLVVPRIAIPEKIGDTVLSKEEYQQIIKLKNAIESLRHHRGIFSDTVRK